MAKPTTAMVRPVGNPVLTNMLIAYMNDDMDYVARRMAPAVPVTESSGTYIVRTLRNHFRDNLERRAYGDTFAQGGFSFGSDTYKTLQWGLEIPIPDELEAESQVPSIRLVQDALSNLASMSNIRKERAFATDFMTTSVWGTDATPTDWDDASGVPVTDSRTARRTIKQATGKTANAICSPRS